MTERRFRGRSAGNVDFLLAEPGDLDRVVSVPQALDNQWVPGAVLRSALSVRSRLGDEEIEAQRRPYVRREYLRSLVNTGQVVVNRGYLYNNPALYQDFLYPGPQREAFKRLLDQRVLIPYLFNESSPADEARFTSRAGWNAWREVVQEVAPVCLRLSWESDERNAELARKELASRSTGFLRHLRDLDPGQLAADFGLPAQAAPDLGRRLLEVARWVRDREAGGQPVAREDVYASFVVADGSSPGDRRYDPDKLFGPQIKYLVDLRYNANLADAVESYLLSPEDSLRRRALQETGRPDQGPADADALAQAIATLRFDQLNQVLGAPAAFEDLTLDGVLDLRSTPAWRRYRTVLDDFLAARPPEQALAVFSGGGHGAEAVALAYREVIREAGPIAARHTTAAVLERWDPKVEVIIEFAGALMSIFYNPNGDGINFYYVLRQVMPNVIARSAKAVFHLVIGRSARARGQARVANSLRVLDTRLENGQQDWEDFQRALRAHGFRALDSVPGRPLDGAALERGDDG